jgi:hypothetical protein
VTTVEPSLPKRVVAVVRALDGEGLPFAIGGALALAYHGEPRLTIDIDINVFVAPTDLDRVLQAFAPLGIGADDDQRRTAARAGQVRLWWGNTAVDVFFAYDEFHFNSATRTRRVPFGDISMPILAAEDLLVCKVVFDRPKDWIDVDQMLLINAGTLDVDDVRRWLTRIVGSGDPRLEHFEERVATILG